MKVLILAGGLGTRLSEETDSRPKPMVEIGGKPILWHIMKTYSKFGFNEFIILLGYKGFIVKEYFANYFLHQSDITFDLANNSMDIMNSSSEPWKVTLLDTGIRTQTAGRIKRARELIDNSPFMLTYGDGVADIDIPKLLERHDSHAGLVTMTAVQPAGRFGSIENDNQGKVTDFMEKPKGDGSWINGGYFVCDYNFFDYLGDDDSMPLEQTPLKTLAKDGQLFIHKHDGFWKCMDTIKDKNDLEDIIASGHTPWL